MNVKKLKHNDSTILKHYRIYVDYIELCRDFKEKHPEFAEAIARSYYYDILCKKHNLTPNYVCSIISRIMANEDRFKKDVLRAEYNLND